MIKTLLLAITLLFSATAFSADSQEEAPYFMDMDFYDPAAEDIDSILEAYDNLYEQMTGLSPYTNGVGVYNDLVTEIGGCRRKNCAVYLSVNLSTQRASLFVHGKLERKYKISSGKKGFGTRTWDGRHNGRVYNAYRSSKYPGGTGLIVNGKDFGNMPYAVFYSGGFAVHGTTSISRLGRPASHGCIRQHPDNAKRFNRLTRKFGRSRTWIRIYWG